MANLLRQVPKIQKKIEKVKSADDKNFFQTYFNKLFGPETYLMKNQQNATKEMGESMQKCVATIREQRNNSFCFRCSGRLPTLLGGKPDLPINNASARKVFDACAKNWYFNALLMY